MANKQTIIQGDVQVNGQLDSLGGLGNSVMSSVKTIAETALGYGVTAAGDSSAALASIADMANDDKLTPLEKSALKLLWDGFEVEKPIIEAQANSAGIVDTDVVLDNYFDAYGALYDYLFATGGVLVTMTTTSDITGTTLRLKCTDYIDRRQDLSQAIQAKLSDATAYAQGVADGAATAASNAQTSANTANSLIADIANEMSATEPDFSICCNAAIVLLCTC